MPEIDSTVIQRARRGDRDAQVVIYDNLYPQIFRYFYYRLADQTTAEDLAADVFVRMISALPTYEERGRPFLAWLYTLARNQLVDHYRKQSQTAALPLDDDRLANIPDTQDSGPVEEAEQHSLQDGLTQALGQLTEDQRQVLILRFIEEREIPEIATMLGRNERAVRSLQHRALAALGRIIEEEHVYES